MDKVQQYLSSGLSVKAAAAFRDNERLAEMSQEERETAAQIYDILAEIVGDETDGTNRFKEGDTVTLLTGYPTLRLQAGSQGSIFAWYKTEPPAYEVTFTDMDGMEFGMVVSENELTAGSDENEPAPVKAS